MQRYILVRLSQGLVTLLVLSMAVFISSHLTGDPALFLLGAEGTQEDYEQLKKNIGLDKQVSITVHFHKRRLTDDQNLYVREGDFVLYGNIYYEIVELNEPKQIFGQNDHKVEISAKCIRSREGLFDAN